MPEVDFARGLAVILMVAFHFAWDLDHFGLIEVDTLEGPFYWFGRAVGSSFIFLLGLSLVLATRRKPASWRFYWQRGVQLLLLGLLVTVATYFTVGRGFVIFGILSLLGLLCFLLYPLQRAPAWLLAVLGVAMVTIGYHLDGVRIEGPWLLWLGVVESGRYMADWYPLLPWGGYGLLGVATGKWLYAERVEGFLSLRHYQSTWGKTLHFLGQHPLVIYLVHQPILMGTFLLLGYRA
ncbi:MAG: heparan-alpha-glucosaminide N-acetyltransferase [Gammaproteobacteria bacterium]|nr:heparan-alpha-glucosaminide N-acetyltransferase [Gammaproteobacteria bacterium]